MDKRKVSFDEIQRTNPFRERIMIPTPKKPSNLVKPDFSPIFEKQNQFDSKNSVTIKNKYTKNQNLP